MPVVFYRRALKLAPGYVDACAWHEHLGDALADSGRGANAADAYLRAARGGDLDRRIELERRAGEQLLICGLTEEGLRVISGVLARVRVSLAAGGHLASGDVVRGASGGAG